MEHKHSPSGSIIDKLTDEEMPRRGFLGAVAAFATAASLAACGGKTEAKPPSTSTTEAAGGAPTSAAPTPEKTATPTPEAPRPKEFTYKELNSGLREWVGLDDTVTRLSAASGEEARREILYEFFGNKSNNGGLPYPELSGPKNARCNIERNAEVVKRATTELATVAALLADASVPEETKEVIISQYGELFMKSNSEEDPLAEIRNMVSKLKVRKERCNLFNMSGGKTESKDPPIPELPALIAVSSSDGRGECISKRRKGNSASSNMLQIAFVNKSLKPIVDSEGKITGYEVDEESAAKSSVCIIEMVPMASDKSSRYSSSLIFGLSNIVPESSQTTIKVEGVEKPISSLRAK